MVLNCSCSHNRLEHIGGDFLSDNHVHKCNVQSCTCTKYHGSRDNDNGYIYKTMLGFFVFAVVGAGAILASGSAIDSYLNTYTVVPEQPIYSTFENGTRTSDTPINQAFDLTGSIQSMVGIVIFIAFYIIGALFLVPLYNQEKRKAIHSK